MMVLTTDGELMRVVYASHDQSKNSVTAALTDSSGYRIEHVYKILQKKNSEVNVNLSNFGKIITQSIVYESNKLL